MSMSELVDAAIKALNERLNDGGIEGSVRFVLEGEGTVRVDEQGASSDGGEADCTITSDAETFQALLAGDLDPTAAFMSGKLSVEGDMGTAMRLASLLA
jgi:putative sterol carrier protein